MLQNPTSARDSSYLKNVADLLAPAPQPLAQRQASITPKPSASGSHRAYYPCFDYLRFILASVVMFGHDDLITWHAAGKYAVDIFFALSGWLIGGMLIRQNNTDLKRFYFNRATRIWVPYYIAFAFLIGASLLKDPLTAKWLEFTLYKLTFVYNIFGPAQLSDCYQAMPLAGTGNHFWSVNAEEQFYLLAPLLLVLLPRFGRSLATWTAIAATTWYFDIYAPISFGVLAAIAVQRFGAFYKTPIGLTVTLAVTLLSAAAIFAGHGEPCSPLMSVGVVMLLAVEGKRQAFGALLGGLSYPLYLNHWIGVFVFNALLGPFGLRDSLPRQILACLFSYCLAAGLYWFIDRKLLSMRGGLFTKGRGRAVTIIAYGSVLLGVLAGLTLTSSA